jgi:uncharacterized membrane protein YgdD (TMEM256/DUF423 family)
MDKTNLVLASLLAGLAVAAGAFGAHGLEQLTTDPKILHTYQTALQYHFWHAVALLLVGALTPLANARLIYWARQSFLAGLLCFCGSLYYLTYLHVMGKMVQTWLVLVTPLGGLFFLLGWVVLALSFAPLKRAN